MADGYRLFAELEHVCYYLRSAVGKVDQHTDLIEFLNQRLAEIGEAIISALNAAAAAVKIFSSGKISLCFCKEILRMPPFSPLPATCAIQLSQLKQNTASRKMNFAKFFSSFRLKSLVVS